MEDKCIRCGACCHYFKDGKLKKCKYLIQIGKSKYHCRIYSNRLGSVIDTLNRIEVMCNYRENRHENFDDCPYNRPEWEKDKKTVNITADTISSPVQEAEPQD